MGPRSATRPPCALLLQQRLCAPQPTNCVLQSLPDSAPETLFVIVTRRWNFSPSPGWTKTEAAILRLCLMKYGVGKWREIEDSGLLPGKMNQQLYGQTQRLLGQQSIVGE